LARYATRARMFAQRLPIGISEERLRFFERALTYYL
jgi:hypothetical protein